MTAYGKMEDAVAAMRLGASDYLTKPLDLKELDLVVARVLEHRRLAANLNYLRSRERSESGLDSVIGDSEPMLAVNSAEPGNIAVSSQNGIRLTSNAGATFAPPVNFVSPPGSDPKGGPSTN